MGQQGDEKEAWIKNYMELFGWTREYAEKMWEELQKKMKVKY